MSPECKQQTNQLTNKCEWTTDQKLAYAQALHVHSPDGSTFQHKMMSRHGRCLNGCNLK